MPTIVTKTVKPNGGGDYLSLKAAIDAEKLVDYGAGPGFLTGAADRILRLECYSGLDSLQAKVEGFNTDPTHYIEIYAALGEGHTGFYDNAKYRLEVSNQRAIEIGSGSTRNVRFKQIQVTVSGSGTSLDGYFVSSLVPTDVDIRFTNCIAKAAFSGQAQGSGFRSTSTASDVIGMVHWFVNCVAIGFISTDSLASESVGFNNFTHANMKEFYYNCLAVNCDRGGRFRSNIRHKNCATIGCRNGWIPTSGPHADSTNNASSGDQDALGTSAKHKRAPFFVDPVNGDFRLHADDTASPRPLAGQAVDLSSDADYGAAGASSAAWITPFNFDIADSTRVTWDIGPSRANYGVVGSAWWCHVGGVTDTTAKVLVRIASETYAIKLRYGTDSTFATFLTATATSLLNGRRLFSLTGLAPNTTYFYAPEMVSPNTGVDLTRLGRFKTLPAPNTSFSFRIAVSGDLETGAGAQTMREVDASDALFFVLNGDAHYENISSNDQAAFRDAYDTLHAVPFNTELYQHRAVVYMWDDHDFGPNDSDGSSPSKAAAQATYRDSTAHHALPEGESASAPVYHSFVVGRVRVVVTDLRSARSPNGSPDSGAKSMMGSAQKQWFKDELLAANAAQQLVAWVCTVPWNSTSDNDSWFGFANERRELADFMQINNLKNIFRVIADRHLIAIDDGSNDLFTTDLIGNGLVSFIAAPLEQSATTDPGGAYSEGAFSNTGQWGLLTVADAGGTTVTVTFSGRRGPTEVVSLTKTYELITASAGIAGGDLGTYANIQSAIANWLNRVGEVEITARIPEFIQMLEDDLRSDQEWHFETYSVTNGSNFTVSELPMVLPTYVRDVKAIWAANGADRHPIKVVTPEVWREFVNLNGDATGTPIMAHIAPNMADWAVTKGARLFLWPRPILPFDIDLQYIRELDRLFVATGGTALSLRHPTIYIYGSLLHAAPFLQHDERVPLWRDFYDRALRRVKIERERAQYSASLKRVRFPRVF